MSDEQNVIGSCESTSPQLTIYHTTNCNKYCTINYDPGITFFFFFIHHFSYKLVIYIINYFTKLYNYV